MTIKTHYKLLPAQFEFLFGYNEEKVNNNKSTHMDVSCYQGGFGSGKTFCGSLRGLLYALTWPGCKGLVGAMSQDLLDGTTKQKYLEHLSNIGMKEDVHYWFTDRGNTIVLKNGSQIRFKTMSDWRQFRSTEFTWIEIEEASLIDRKTFEELIARVREQEKDGWKNYFRSIFLHTNPGGARGWIYKLFHNPKTKLPGYRAVIASTKENHHLGEGYYENLLALYGADDVQELLGGIDVDKDNTVAFPYFNILNIQKVEYDKRYPLILTCDFNYNPMCWYLMQERDGVWYVLRELIDQNVTTGQMCELILPILETYSTKDLMIMGDSHGRDRKTNGSDYSVMLSFFSSRGYNCTLRVQKANPLIKERLATLRKTICNGKGERFLFIDESCTRLLYNFDECKNNLANGGLKAPTEAEVRDDINKLFLIHPIDAISYPIHFTQTLKEISS